jgi:hypothetical protein
MTATSQNLQALLTAKIRCEQGTGPGAGSSPNGGYGRSGSTGGGSNVMNMDNDF